MKIKEKIIECQEQLALTHRQVDSDGEKIEKLLACKDFSPLVTINQNEVLISFFDDNEDRIYFTFRGGIVHFSGGSRLLAHWREKLQQRIESILEEVESDEH